MNKTHNMSQSRITISLRIVFKKYPGVLRAEARGEGDDALFIYHRKWNETPSFETDPWRMRREFLGWPVDSWRDFVSRYGNFHPFRRVSKGTFSRWQRLLRTAQITRAIDWRHQIGAEFGEAVEGLLHKSLQVKFDVDSPSPAAEITVKSALDAMIATLYVDALNGARYRECKRPDCPNPPFPLETKHDKIYCSTECAHLMAVRADRERKAAKSKANESRANNRSSRARKG